ncbi:hypothetical protein B0G81_3023 [Paraburkholderia sp. BL6665CI2N2]|nr:hypothetical protein B0G81_3023 [Paraburkholderia sp. BL6665CI2N2]
MCRSAVRTRLAAPRFRLALGLPRLPLGERASITFERFVVEIEYTWIAAAMTTVVEIGLHGRHRLRVVLRCGSGHGKSRSIKAGSGQYKLIPRRLLLVRSRQPRPTNGILLAMIVMNCTFVESGSSAMCSTASATC